jgi:hypothetical protein
MAAQITTYGGLRAGVLAWMARSGDSVLDSRFDDFLLNCERRIYYGYAIDRPDNPLRSEPLRIPEMEVVDASFALSATTAQPVGFLELISGQMNSPAVPLQIVGEHVIDSYLNRAMDRPRLIAVSGTNLRVKEDPAGAAATLRFYQKLATPAGSTANAILAGYPDVYLYGCLIEAAIFTQDEPAALRYAGLYGASISGLNVRGRTATASVSPVNRNTGGPTP